MNEEPKINKPIGRRLDFMRGQQTTSGIAPATVAFIVVLVAVLAFIAGTRVDGYGLIGNYLSSDGGGSTTLPSNLDYSSVEKVFDTLKRDYDGELEAEQLLDGLKRGLAEATGDPYTTYLNAEQAQEFEDDLNGTFSGIGAEIGRKGEFIVIMAPLKGFPADVAGLKTGDMIITIDDEEVIGWSIDEAILAIRGESGTDVKLAILRDGKQIEMTITRKTIVIPSVESEITDGGIGIMTISRFGEDTFALAQAAAEEFVAEGVTGVVLDLRNNTGGFLQSAIDVSGLWLDGELVTEQREDGGATVTEEYYASEGSILGDIKTIVLMNGGSASASEIVIGALKDHGHATILGTTSFGKGSVQNLERLDDGGVLKVTVARWYTPDGDNIDQEGIKPDMVVALDLDSEDDTQLEAAIKELLR